MRYTKWIGLLAVIILVVAAFLPWIFIETKNLTISGVDTTGTVYGKPAYFHFVMSVFFLAFTFIPRVWAKRSNFLITALNLGWALRNFLMIPACQGGECPDKKEGLWLTLIASVLMLITALFPDMKLAEKKSGE